MQCMTILYIMSFDRRTYGILEYPTFKRFMESSEWVGLDVLCWLPAKLVFFDKLISPRRWENQPYSRGL